MTAAIPSVTVGTVETALAATIGRRRSLRLLAEHLAAHPDVLTVGPTSTLGVLDRFVIALVEAGAPMATIHPECGRCGRQRRWHARTPGGGQCSACWARTHREPCFACGRQRNVNHRDPEGRPTCYWCVEAARRRHRLEELSAEVVATVVAAQPRADPEAVAGVVERMTPDGRDRLKLARLVQAAADLTVPFHRQVRVARLLAELRAAGIELARGAVPGLRRPGRAAGRLPPGCPMRAVRSTMPGLRAFGQATDGTVVPALR
ncbi:MAG: hypothetical protein ACRD2W_24815 [Acidimicrobiales bacterium]